MNWDYLAGLFDGEGSISLIYRGGLGLQIRIASSSPKFREEIVTFLREENIFSIETEFKVKMGKTGYVEIKRWNDGAKLIEKLIVRCYEKREKLLIAKEIVDLHTSLKESNQTVKDHLKDFDILRHRLHGLSQKGRHELKKW